MNELRVTYTPDDQWSGEIEVRVSVGSFAGQSHGWTGSDAILDFATSLDQYPIQADQPANFEVCLGASIDGKIPARRLIAISVLPHDQLGHLLVRSDLLADVWIGAGQASQSVTASFITEYGLIERFAGQLRRLVRGDIDEAVLTG